MKALNPWTKVGVIAVLLCGAGLFAAHEGDRPVFLRILAPKTLLPADGRFHRVGLVTLAGGNHVEASAVSVTGLPAYMSLSKTGHTELSVQSPVLSGDRTIRISYGRTAINLGMRFTSYTEDTVGDGTPDFLRLHTAEDRIAFRFWFTALAEAAADEPKEKLPPELDDCAALLRWCYRNALHAHDEAWLSTAPASLDLAGPSVRQYAYPFTPFGAALFRVRERSAVPGEVNGQDFAQFADARTLWRYNTFLLSRQVGSARPGDLLFYRQLEQNSPFHSMIVTGTAQKWVVYHTGPIGKGPGEVRRVLLDDLIRHPDPRWRPLVQNSNFLGVYRWNILQEDPR